MSFGKINPEDLVISADSVTGTVWTGNVPNLTTVFTSSTQEASNIYYLEVYNTGSSISGSEVQFSLEYGHLYGSGSNYYNSTVLGMTPTRTIYGQFRTLVNGDENTNFNFGTNTSSSRDIYIISVNRARYKENLFPASLNLYLTSGSNTVHLTDNSRDVSTITYTDAGRVFDIVSGSSGNAITTVSYPGVAAGYTPSGSYGKFLPDVGLIILNPRALSLPAVSGGILLQISESSNSAGLNNRRLFAAINAGIANGFALNSEETITSDYIFVRVKNAEFNYTTNPSIVSSSGALIYSNLINDPQTYITTVGLYNDNSDLLAVAKLSKPLPKDFTKEALIRMKLDF
jgi:hypothetical protein